MADDEKNSIRWTEDGTILVLALYKEYYIKYLNEKKSNKKNCNINPNDEVCFKYNFLIKKIPDKKGKYINQNANSKKGIEAKYRKFYSLNPNDERVGFKKSTKIEREVWGYFEDEFITEKVREIGKLEQNVERIIKSIGSEIEIPGESNATGSVRIVRDVFGYFVEEGRKRIIREHESRERNPKIIRLKKEEVKREKGFLACEACKFNFAQSYGEHGEDFIECHHKSPVSQMKIGDKTSLEDLALVCSNCHRMIHRGKGDCLTIKQLKLKIR